MPINEIIVEKFKGIREKESIKLRPITLFIGANSSGKSSCIHALACLSQTAKLPNNSKPLILDDEYANVHLGRFIEVIHTRSYKDSIVLGINLGTIKFNYFDEGGKTIVETSGVGTATYSFKSTMRTQDIYLDTANLTVGEFEYHIKKNGNIYLLKSIKDGYSQPISLGSSFFFEMEFSPRIGENYFKLLPLFDLQRAITLSLKNTVYLGPFRQSPQRSYPTRGSSPTEVGALGEATITLLANEIIQKQSREHVDQMAGWLNHMGLAKKIEVTRIARSELFDVNLTLPDGNSFPLADLGYGLSQVLPVLAQCSFAQVNSTLLFEQPEIHLHSIAARGLAKVFIDTVKNKKSQLLIETHSPDLLHQLQTELRLGNISSNQIIAYKVYRDDMKTCFKKIEIDDDGYEIYGNWEKGITSN